MTDLARINQQIRARLGIHLGPQKAYLLQSRLEKLRRQEGYPDLETLSLALEAGDPAAVEALARHVTTNHTFFFRESVHFDLLVDLLRRGDVVQPRIWSAAGSTGEEGYSLGMTLAEAGFRDFLVLVSDVNRDVLRRAHRGVYEPARLDRVPRTYIERYFQRLASGEFQVKQVLRSRLRFRSINLVEPMAPGEPVDAIFCRNVLIYFDDEVARAVLARLVAALRPGGWLFLGQTEGMHHPPGPVKRLAPSVYQKLATN